jgi:cytoskeletal protein CcmA (bactofilin family)
MFTRKTDDRPAPGSGRPANGAHGAGGPPPLPTARPARARRAAGAAPSVIGSDLSITGNLETTGEVQIEGDVQGDVSAGRIVVGEQGRIVGALTADEIVIGGSVQGSVRGNSVTFAAASRIEGDVFHRSLAIEQGAFFEGKSRRSDDPLAARDGADAPSRS